MIPLMKHAFYNEYETKKELADFILKTDMLSMSGMCQEFEKGFSKFIDAKNSILFNSGGSANLALLQALKNLGKLKNGSKIGFSALTWSTNVMPILQLSMLPVAIDITTDTLNIMSENLNDFLIDNTIDALFITNALGFAGDLENIKNICKNNNIILIEDNCEALGTIINNKKTGTFGLAGTHSFFVAHHMSTIEGGMVSTNDEELSIMLKIVRANGWDRNLASKEQRKLRNKHGIHTEFQAKYSFYDLGFNLRPTEITGFLGVNQLQYLEKTILKREENHKILEKVVIENDDLIFIKHEHINLLSGFAFPVITKSTSLRDKYIGQFSGAGVEVRPIISGNIQFQPFYKKYVKNIRDLPNASFIHENGFYFGNYPELNNSDLEILINCLTKY
jgi:CDP-4-dehydro-6-deoxyglucose reductase, E1